MLPIAARMRQRRGGNVARTLSTDDLICLAEADGISVEWHTGGPKGMWIPSRRAISLRHGLDEIQSRCTLAHELGHAYYNHPGGHDPKHEAAADRRAAWLLVSASDYAHAEGIYGPVPARIAAELGVTVHLLGVWREMWDSCCSEAV
ncbi:ImmA/IrrE family metallo-endopeptidase [Corynebacterium mastitidis]|uniref:ImmA/IrrE family metallo-endopeptidase n=1 Tax=Corynebacterium mastitidis TaxID=161890 RepID=UPI003140937C